MPPSPPCCAVPGIATACVWLPAAPSPLDALPPLPPKEGRTDHARSMLADAQAQWDEQQNQLKMVSSP